MASTVKSGSLYVITTAAICIVLMALPYICFGKEMKHINAQFYMIVVQAALFFGCLAFLFLAWKGRDEDSNGKKMIACLFAIIFCIVGCASGASYRSNASDNIQFDKSTK